MLTIRPFQNEDPPRLLTLWKKSQAHRNRSRLLPLSMNILQMQTLGIPFFDPRSIMLAFDEGEPVGYVHATVGPNTDGSDLSDRSGQICFLCVDPEYADLWGAGRALLHAGECYLMKKGVEEIYGGSPRPCAPFYIGFFGGSEPIGFFDADQHLIQVFQESGYKVHKNTIRYRLDLDNYSPPVTPTTVGWRDRVRLAFNDLPIPKTWWEACSFALFEWIEVIAYLGKTNRPIARIRVRISNPDTGNDDMLYAGIWSAALMDVRVHPDFHQQGVAAYTLGEMLRHLVVESQATQIEAHVEKESAPVNSLLRSLYWDEIDTGKLFKKIVEDFPPRL